MYIALTADPEIPVPPIHYGGIERIIAMLIDELQAEGHRVLLFAHRDSQVSCELVGYPATGHGTADAALNTWAVNRGIFRRRIDILHSFGRMAYLLPQLPRGLPKIMSYQREPTINQIKKAVWLAKKGTLLFTGCSDYITDQIKPFAAAATVYNGVDLTKYSPALSVAADAPLVFLGRIEPIKGAHIAIRIALESGRKLIIAGNVPREHQIYFEQEIKPFLGSLVEYIGPVDDASKCAVLRSSSALLMPIQWNEPFGIVMAEAMACGTPVLALNKGAVPEIVQNGLNGFTGQTAGDLVRAVTRLPEIDRSRVLRLARERFSANVISREYILHYKRLITPQKNAR